MTAVEQVGNIFRDWYHHNDEDTDDVVAVFPPTSTHQNYYSSGTMATALAVLVAGAFLLILVVRVSRQLLCFHTSSSLFSSSTISRCRGHFHNVWQRTMIGSCLMIRRRQQKTSPDCHSTRGSNKNNKHGMFGFAGGVGTFSSSNSGGEDDTTVTADDDCSNAVASSFSHRSTMHDLIDQLELELCRGQLPVVVNDPLIGAGGGGDKKRMPAAVFELQKQGSFAIFYDDDEEDEDCGRLRPVPPVLVSSSEYYSSRTQQRQQRRYGRGRRYRAANTADMLLWMQDSVPGDEELGYYGSSSSNDNSGTVDNDELLYPACQDPGLMSRHFSPLKGVVPTSFSVSDDEDDDDDDHGASLYYCYKYNNNAAHRTGPRALVVL